MARFTIARAAKAANVNVETVRYYERKGLIDQPPTPAHGGGREYNFETVARIRFIRQAQEIGFSLREIGELLSLRTDPTADCAEVRRRAIEKRDEVEAKLARLASMHRALEDLIANCPGSGNVKACTILGAMQDPTATLGSASQEPMTESTGGTIEMKTTILTIEGMHCDGCARTVEALLSRVPGVRTVEASYDERLARVLHDESQSTSDALSAAIAKGGFTAIAADP